MKKVKIEVSPDTRKKLLLLKAYNSHVSLDITIKWLIACESNPMGAEW